jgi:protein-S-isoprenylcysteine O-methyltransferase Ste14
MRGKYKSPRGKQTKKIVAYLEASTMGITIFVSYLEYSWREPAPNLLVTSLGLVVLALVVGIRHLSLRTLGKYFSSHIEIKESHRVVRDGIYGKIRHPAYLANLLLVLALQLILGSYSSMLLLAFFMFPLALTKIHFEERALKSELGEVYESYTQEVPMFVPRLKSQRRS